MHIRCKDDLALTETLLPNIQPFSGGTRTGYQDTMVYDDRTTHRPTVGVITYVKEWHKSYWTQAQTRITRLIIFFCKNTEDIQHIIIELSLFTCSIHEQTHPVNLQETCLFKTCWLTKNKKKWLFSWIHKFSNIVLG